MGDNLNITTLGDRQRSRAERDRNEPADEFGLDELEPVTEVFQAILKESSVSVGGQSPEDTFDGVRQDITNRTNINLDGISEEIGSVGDELDGIETSQGYLLAIAQATVASAKLNQVAATSQIAQLSTLQSVLQQVSPLSSIRVSGSNTIDRDNSPEQVVPGSETEDIPTRMLFIQAAQSNKYPIFFGDDAVAPNSGFRLDRGEFINYEINLNGDSLYMAAEEAGQTVNLLGVN